MSTDVPSLIDLMVNAKLDKALQALQLCLELLPPSCREELCRLLGADPGQIKRNKEMENRLAVMRSIRPFLHSRMFYTLKDRQTDDELDD